jgi:hypothetical protein
VIGMPSRPYTRTCRHSGAATAASPAGILYDVASLTPAAAGVKSEIVVDDIAALVTAVSAVSGNSEILLIGGPDTATGLRLRLYQPAPWTILTSTNLPARTVVAIAANAIAAVVESPPQVSVSTQAELHRADPASELVEIGGVLAKPLGSTMQADLVALKVRWPLSWCVRDPRGVAWFDARLVFSALTGSCIITKICA